MCVLILSNAALFSQMRGGYRQRNPNNQGQKIQEAPKLSIDKMVQLFFYDDQKVTKALKIKSEAKKLSIINELEHYNNKLIEIRAFNNETLTTAKALLKSKRMESKRVGDPLIMNEARVRLKKILAPIRNKVSQQKILLNQSFKKELTPKEYTKWLKYLKNKTTNKTNRQITDQSHIRSQRQF